MDLYDAMSTLRAVRRLRPDPIDKEVIERFKAMDQDGAATSDGPSDLAA